MSTIQDTVYLTYKLSEKLKSANIDIWLTYGSSLGAVREGQIIADLSFSLNLYVR